MPSCSLCGDLNSLDVVFDDGRCAIVLHEDWAVRGHAMVVWKHHVENIADLDDAEAAHLIHVEREAERALLAETGTARAILMKLGLATPHLHIHIYPVPATMTRAGVFDAIDGRSREEYDSAFVTRLRDHLRDVLDSARKRE